MHDIDRTQSEWLGELDEFQPEQLEYNFESDFESEMGGSPFSEAEELALAGELLGVTDERELDQFLGNVFKKVWGGIKKVAKPLGGMLKGIAKKALPFVGGALGSMVPCVGTAIGTTV